MTGNLFSNIEENASIINNDEVLFMLKERFNSTYDDYTAVTPTLTQAITALMEKRRWNSLIFKEKTTFDDALYSRIKNHKLDRLSFRTTITLCAGLGMDVETAKKTLASAGYSFGANKEHQAYCYLFTMLRGKSLDEWNAFLEYMSIAPLGSRERSSE